MNSSPMRGSAMLCSQTSSLKFSHASQFHHHRRRSLLVKAVTPNGSESTLHDPAHLGGTSKATVPVQDVGGERSLENFMRLPPSHYSALDPDLIESLGGEKFRLRVPRLKLFSLWIEPTVDIVVSSADTQNPRVLLTSESCHIIGSDLIQRMQLDKRFILNFSTELTWKTAPNGQITGNLELEVATEVIPPFQVLPRSVLEGTCNAVLRRLMKTLLPKFMQLLADDYTKWATDPSYRLGAGAGAEEEEAVRK